MDSLHGAAVGCDPDEERFSFLEKPHQRGTAGENDDVYFVPKRYLQSRTEYRQDTMIAPCKDPSTYVDLTHFPAYFSTMQQCL